MNGKKFDTGELVKGEFSTSCPRAFRAMRSTPAAPSWQDVRVREALGLAVDYEWMNRQMFYGAYQRGERPVWQHGLRDPGHRHRPKSWR